MLPHVKITELLEEVARWTSFTRHFTLAKSRLPAGDKQILLSTIRADGINIGLTKMAESCPGTTYAKLAWAQAWHIRDETYSTALAELVNAQFRHPFAAHWGSASHRHPTANASEPAGKPTVRDTSTEGTARNRDVFSIPMSPINTRRSTPK